MERTQLNPLEPDHFSTPASRSRLKGLAAMSRYPTFGGSPLYPYDRTLLAGAPSVTRQDRQAGYNIDILERGVIPQSQAPYPGPNPFTDTTPNLPNKELPQDPRVADTPSPVPIYTYRWYQTKRGIAIIVLIVLIVLSVIVGIAVGVANAKQQAALAAAQPADTGPDSDSDSGAAPTVSPSAAPSTSNTGAGSPFRTLDPVQSTRTPAAPTRPPAATPTPTPTTPQVIRPSTAAVPPSTSSSALSPGQSGNEGNPTPWYCKLLPFVC